MPASIRLDMSEITYTDGTKVVFNFQCDCGLTGGCEKCQPFVYTPEMQKWDVDLANMGMDEYRKNLEETDKEERRREYYPFLEKSGK